MQLRSVLACALLFAGCGTDSGGTSDPSGTQPDAGGTGDLPPPSNGFQVRTPDIQLSPGQEATYCYYFHTPNTSDVVVKSWQSSMTPGSHHMILYFMSTAAMPDGTLDPSGNCGGADTNNLAVWTYLAQSPEARSDMPSDDGTGKPIGMPVSPGQAAAVQLHYLNATDNPITVHATLNAEGYVPGTAYTQAGAYVTYNSKIDIPPGPGTTATADGNCAVPAGAKFFNLSTHSHKQSVETDVMDGATMVQKSTDWEHPTTTTWQASPFFSFASGKLSYACNYLNSTPKEIKAGPSAQTNEMCMAIAYFFPATGAKFCLNSVVIR